MCEGRGVCKKCDSDIRSYSASATKDFFDHTQYYLDYWNVKVRANLDQGRYVYPTFSLKEENHALAEDDLVERINAILIAKENKPKHYFCAFEKTEKGVWHVHCLLYYEKSGHQGLGASFFKRYWNLGYVHLEKVTVDEASITRIATYMEKQPYRKIGTKEMILKPFKAIPPN